jgi:hypothetical protein
MFDSILDHIIVIRYNRIELYTANDASSSTLKDSSDDDFIKMRLYDIPVSEKAIYITSSIENGDGS